MKTIAEIIRKGILAGKSNEEILGDVYKDFPHANTKAASVSWYRSQMKKGGEASSSPKAKPTEVSKAAKTASAGGYDFKPGVGFVAKDDASKAAAGKADAGPFYTVAKIKKTTGMEGEGYLCDLLRDGKLVAKVANYGDGGETHFDWLDKNGVPALVISFDHNEQEVKRKGTQEEAMFYLYCRHLPKWNIHGGLDEPERLVHVTPDIAVDNMVNDVLVLKQVRSLTKNRLAVIEGGKVYTYKCEPTETNIANYKGKHPEAIVLNGLSELDVLQAMRKLQD